MATRRKAKPSIPTIFELLRAEHRFTSKQLEELADLLEDDADEATCLDLFHQIAGGLLAHARAENEVVYPAFARGKRQPTMEAYEEHALVEHVIADILAHGEVDEVWQAKVKVLTDLVKHHVKEEEGPIFRAAQRKLTAARSRELADEFRAAKTAAMARMARPRRSRGNGAAARH
jgi:hypothetical protein